MKKCSKSHHEALAELNITPLLDLAFVLLVIFIITTTPIINDLEIDLPKAANRPKEPKPKIHYVTVDRSGKIYLDKVETQNTTTLLNDLVSLRMGDANVNLEIRGSAHAKYRGIVEVLDVIQQAQVGKINFATEAIADVAAKKK